MPKAAKASSTPRRTASKIPTKKRAKAKRAAPRADAGLFAAIERYYDAVREYDIRLKIFSKVEFIEPRPRGWVLKERAYLRAMNHYGRVEREVIAIRAKTLDGLIAKATAANNEFCQSADIQASVAEDVLRMQPGRGKAVQS